MLITCPICKQICETEQDLVEGQHVVCPFCRMKFAYGYHGSIVISNQKGFHHKGFPSTRKQMNEAQEKQKAFSSKFVIVVGAAVILVGCIVVGSMAHIRETPIEKIRREFREAEEKTSYYTSSEEIDVDLCAPASERGVFGLNWGENPRHKKYKTPCCVDYPISHGLYSRMQLMYGEDGGLMGVTLHGPQRLVVPDYSGVPANMRAELQQEFVTRTCVPVFDVMRQLAEQILQQRMRCFRGAIQLTGMTGGDSRCLGMIRMDIRGPGLETGEKNNKDPEQVFMVMRKQ